MRMRWTDLLQLSLLCFMLGASGCQEYSIRGWLDDGDDGTPNPLCEQDTDCQDLFICANHRCVGWDLMHGCAQDTDEDGIEDDFDNCPLTYNRDQADADMDGFGDVCDNCDQFNPEQIDSDQDQIGDPCDPDVDGDGIPNPQDNCPRVENPAQQNSDGDSAGDLCDQDLDGDGFNNLEDNCPYGYNPDQNPDDPLHLAGCLRDTDQDGIVDFLDNCWLVSNPDQADMDSDGQGDPCDADLDGDGFFNDQDNCPGRANPDQQDLDLDATGDACDGEVCLWSDDLGACLDPSARFRVQLKARRERGPGEIFCPVFWANRNRVPIQYQWTLTSRPPGSRASIINSQGTTDISVMYDYHYWMDRPVLIPDLPGTYELELQARLETDDELFPQFPESSASCRLIVE